MSTSCPICEKVYPLEIIETHVEKCLFLNSKTDNHKRNSEQETNGATTSSSTPKRTKMSKELDDSSLFSEPSPQTFQQQPSTTGENRNKRTPLAEKMRPTSLSDFIGQEHILGDNMTLRVLLEKNTIPSMILWGPPGCGKTTLAHIIHKKCQENKDVRFVKLSATLSGVNSVKDIIQIAKNDEKMLRKKTLLFMDEIHRFNKLQQDIFLPCVESGLITLIGATTENPSFSLNSALLSRCRVIVLEKLNSANIEQILQRAALSCEAFVYSDADDESNLKENHKYKISYESIKWLSEMCDGDARIALNSLQLAFDSANKGDNLKEVALEDIKKGIMKSHLLYDRKGEEHYNIISAMHKSIRASDDNAALYWLARMLEGGEDPIFIARRLVRAASEDIGLADPMALPLAVTAMQGCQLLGMPECDVLLAQTAIYLARAEKSQEAYRGLLKAKECIKNHKGPLPSVPLHLRNAPTRLMRDLGYGRGYNMLHRDESNLDYMPEGMESVEFF